MSQILKRPQAETDLLENGIEIVRIMHGARDIDRMSF